MNRNQLRWSVIICVLLLCGAVQSAFAFHIGLLRQGSIANADENIAYFIADNPGFTWEPIDDNTVFNAMSVADLLATYDALVVPWQINSTADLDWDTRIRPYLEGGGGVLWEDPTNVGDGDLNASGITFGGSYPGIGGDDITLVPPFSNNGAIGWYHIHFGIAGHSTDWFPWSTDVDGGIHGVGGEFGAGRMLVGVSDNLYHPDMSDTVNPDTVGAYNLLRNQIFWLGTGSVDDDPTGPSGPYEAIPTLSQWAFVLLFAVLALVGVARLRRVRN